MRANKSKGLPTKPPVWISDHGRRVWSLVRDEIVRAGHDDGRFVIPVGLLSDAFGAFLQSCELKTSEYADARAELIREHRSRVRLVLESFPNVELPFIEAGDELKATRLSCQCELRSIEAEISETIAEGERWHGLLRTQSSIHWRLITLTLLVDSDEFLRKLEATDDDGESWKGGAGE